VWVAAVLVKLIARSFPPVLPLKVPKATPSYDTVLPLTLIWPAPMPTLPIVRVRAGRECLGNSERAAVEVRKIDIRYKRSRGDSDGSVLSRMVKSYGASRARPIEVEYRRLIDLIDNVSDRHRAVGELEQLHVQHRIDAVRTPTRWSAME